ncbi:MULTISPECIES: hypothetical protein [unclassified Mesorhizobium]|uniref:hypothetical protein n=1 Tax=unclassified Mesorhizobium TaxID=325217 RepID=UPI000FCAC46C|nr:MULTISPECIES: hypothetical protein [unclassified Mesorhizobium]RUT80940.1 hypothetical protein EOD15_33905 [Mesorhizobium sp. M7A.T.Ca.US.000.02.2.1]RUT88020.1 hypothetical protein EOD14_08280 [Mesorhizobium sp. M7A.T.Ca.US.000.02.1.1]
MEYRNPTYNTNGGIDMEVDHPAFGWIPFTASPEDPEELGRTLFEDTKGTAAPYVAPPAPTVEEIRAAMPSLSPRQIRLALNDIGITSADVATQLAGNEAGTIEWNYATYFKRTHPLIVSLTPAFSLTEAQVDSLWLYAAEIK